MIKIFISIFKDRYSQYRIRSRIIKTFFSIIGTIQELRLKKLIQSGLDIKKYSTPNVVNVGIFCPGHLGDFVLTLAAYEEVLRKSYPKNYKFTFILGSWNKEISACLTKGKKLNYIFLDHPISNRKYNFYLKYILSFLNFKKRVALLRGHELYMVIFPYTYRPTLAKEAFYANIPLRVGYVSSCNEEFLNFPMQLAFGSEKSIGNEFLSQFYLISYAYELLNGHAKTDAKIKFDEYKCKNFKFQIHENYENRYWVIHSTASVPSKDLSLETIEDIHRAALLLSRKLVFTGQRIREDISSILECRNSIDMIGATNMESLIDVIEKSELIISADTLAAHISAYYSKPQIILNQYFQNDFIPIYGNILYASKDEIFLELINLYKYSGHEFHK